MSRETAEWLNANTLVGFGRKAWHFALDGTDASEANHYDGPIPMERTRELLETARAEYAPVTVTMPDGTEHKAENKAAIVRADSSALYAVMSPSYRIHQHTELLDTMGDVVGASEGGLGIASAGLLQNGAVGWVSASLADTAHTAAGVEFATYLLTYGSHNGRHASSWKLVNQLVVCDNTLDIATGEVGVTAKVRHTVNSLDRISDIRGMLGIVVGARDAFAEEVERLCATPFSEGAFDQLLNIAAPLPEDEGRGRTMAENKREALADLWTSDVRVAPWRGTAFGALQALNTYRSWLGKGTAGEDGQGKARARAWDAVLTGQAAEADSKALSAVLSLA